MYTFMSPGDFTEINDVFGCGKYGMEVSTGKCLPFNRAINADAFAGFSACSGYSGKHTLVHDGDHGGGHTNPDLSFIVIVGALVTWAIYTQGQLLL